MKRIFGSRKTQSLLTVSILLVTLALIAGMVGCDGGGDYNPPPSQNLEIQTWYDLAAIRDNLAGNHTLMNDLDSTTAGYIELASPTANQGKGWQPIGTWISQGSEYYTGLTGTFNGQGYEIRDLSINRPDEDFIGIFGFIDDEGIIEDIGVVNATVIGAVYVGGLLGCNGGTVSNSYFTGNVTGFGKVGGLVGFNSIGTLSKSYSTGRVAGNESVGGLVGETLHNSIVSNSYSTSNVTGIERVGGLVGNLRYGTVNKSYSTGSVTGNNWTGGLVGRHYSGYVTNSFWDIETSGQTDSHGGGTETGKTTTEMQKIITFSGAGWNIIEVALNETNPAYIWNIVNNVTYPFLSWEP